MPTEVTWSSIIKILIHEISGFASTIGKLPYKIDLKTGGTASAGEETQA